MATPAGWPCSGGVTERQAGDVNGEFEVSVSNPSGKSRLCSPPRPKEKWD